VPRLVYTTCASPWIQYQLRFALATNNEHPWSLVSIKESSYEQHYQETHIKSDESFSLSNPHSQQQQSSTRTTKITPPSSLQPTNQAQPTKLPPPIQPIMSIFKSNKNKTASAASTPAQTPRASLNDQRSTANTNPTHQIKMTRDQALELVLSKSTQIMPSAHNLM
jgi:hypothetical protein